MKHSFGWIVHVALFDVALFDVALFDVTLRGCIGLASGERRWCFQLHHLRGHAVFLLMLAMELRDTSSSWLTCVRIFVRVNVWRCLSCYCCDRCDITGHPSPPTGKCPPACLSAILSVCLWLLSSFAALLDHQPRKEDFWPWRPQNDTC